MTTSLPVIPTNRFQSFEMDDYNKNDTQPLISRASSYPVTANHPQRRRRADAKLSSPRSLPVRQRSFTRNIGHAASETYLVTGLTFKLLAFLGVGYRWIWRVLSLCFYAMLLMPGFLQVAYYYFFSSQVRRSIVYGDQPRNRFDLYLPKNSDGPKPVLAFVTGGAWIIGYKAWGSLLGKQLAERDIIVACFDYRNFPQGTITDMVEDVSQGISFLCNNVVEYGGDPDRIYLMGQSAGAHISSCALLDQAVIESEGGSISWSVSQIKAYFGLSGGYNIPSLVEHFHRRGLYRSIFLSIMEGEKSLPHFSPEIRVKDPSICNAVALLPKIILFHGTSDCSIPSDARSELKHISAPGTVFSYARTPSAQAQLAIGKTRDYPVPGSGREIPVRTFVLTILSATVQFSNNLKVCIIECRTFADALQQVGAKAELILYSGKTHTDLFLHDPMRGGKDELFDYVVAFIHAGDKEALAKDAVAPPRPRLLPELLLQLARKVSPF